MNYSIDFGEGVVTVTTNEHRPQWARWGRKGDIEYSPEPTDELIELATATRERNGVGPGRPVPTCRACKKEHRGPCPGTGEKRP